MKKRIIITMLIIGCTLFTGCSMPQIEHRLVGVGDLKYDNINGLIYEKNEFDEWVPTGRKIFFEGEFR